MDQVKLWPPPASWHECVITWDYILESSTHPQEIYNWCDLHPSEGRYHVHGWESTEGFAFRFENPYDAVTFILKWKY